MPCLPPQDLGDLAPFWRRVCILNGGSFLRVEHLHSFTHCSLSRPSCRLFCVLPSLGNTIDVDPEGRWSTAPDSPSAPPFSCPAGLRKPKKARRFIILRLLKGFAGIVVKRGFVSPVQRYSCSDINFSVDAFAGRFRHIRKSPRTFGLLECGTPPKKPRSRVYVRMLSVARWRSRADFAGDAAKDREAAIMLLLANRFLGDARRFFWKASDFTFP